MTVLDVVILLGVAVWAIAAINHGWKNRKRGCGGSCSNCRCSCNKKENRP